MANEYDCNDWQNDQRGASVDDFERPTHSRILGPDGNRLPYEEFRFGFQPSGSKKVVRSAKWNTRSIRKAFGK